jgi:hypothetical protein
MKTKHRFIAAAFTGWILPFVIYWLGGGDFTRGESLAATFVMAILFAALGCVAWGLVEAEMLDET